MEGQIDDAKHSALVGRHLGRLSLAWRLPVVRKNREFVARRRDPIAEEWKRSNTLWRDGNGRREDQWRMRPGSLPEARELPAGGKEMRNVWWPTHYARIWDCHDWLFQRLPEDLD